MERADKIDENAEIVQKELKNKNYDPDKNHEYYLKHAKERCDHHQKFYEENKNRLREEARERYYKKVGEKRPRGRPRKYENDVQEAAPS